MNVKKKSIVAGIMLYCIIASVKAQRVPPDSTINDSTINKVALDFSAPPSSPAFTVLGVTPENIIRPGDIKTFGASLLNAVDANGNLQNGLAIDAAPFQLLTTLEKYRTNAFSRALANIQLSAATVKGQSAQDASTRASLGINIVLFNKADERLNSDLYKTITTTRKNAEENDPQLKAYKHPGATPDEIAQYDKRLSQVIGNALDDYAKRNTREGPMWVLAAAPTWISQTGKAENLVWDGFGVWSSYMLGNTKNQFILHGRYRNREKVAIPDQVGQYITQNSGLFGARFRTGGANLKVSAEAGVIFTNPQGRPNDEWGIFSVIFEPRIFQNVWLNVAFNAEGGRQSGNNVGFRTAFKYGFSSN